MNKLFSVSSQQLRIPKDAPSFRLLIHWRNFPAYAANCIAQLRKDYPITTLLLFDLTNINAPYKRDKYEGVGEVCNITNLSKQQLEKIVQDFQPNAALVGGWTNYARIIASAVKKIGAPVIAASDVMKRKTWRQNLFPLYYHLVLKQLHDYYWVPGKKAQEYLTHQGINPQIIWQGFYSSDLKSFGYTKTFPKSINAKVFLFIGQYINRKGIPELLQAFTNFNNDSQLIMCGDGPLKTMVQEYALRFNNICDRGFIQPQKLPEIMAQADVLILPSREDNWGLVVLEAAAAGLALICSDACGAAYDLIQEEKNGFIFPAGDVAALTKAMEKINGFSNEQLVKMGEISRQLSQKYSSNQWADCIYQNLSKLLPNKK
jgi:glycosyltransferase involved in cell wall biosynthesis